MAAKTATIQLSLKDVDEFMALYKAVCELMVELGSRGEIKSWDIKAANVATALERISELASKDAD